MKQERILRKPDGTLVLFACKSVGVDGAYPHVKAMHAYRKNGFPKEMPVDDEEPSIWTAFESDYSHSA